MGFLTLASLWSSSSLLFWVVRGTATAAIAPLIIRLAPHHLLLMLLKDLVLRVDLLHLLVEFCIQLLYELAEGFEDGGPDVGGRALRWQARFIFELRAEQPLLTAFVAKRRYYLFLVVH